MEQKNQDVAEEGEQQSFFRVIVHSFFIIPFLIAVFCFLLFGGITLLTKENRTAYDYLEDVKTGAKNKRWHGAFELSKILSNPKHVPKDDRFTSEIISAFEYSLHDDNRVRQYLALAMGRTGSSDYTDPLIKGLKVAKEENLWAIIYGLGMIKDLKAASVIEPFVEHNNPRIRSIAVVSLGNIKNLSSENILIKALNDSEPNVQWGSAISLAHMGNDSGQQILLKLMDREYLATHPQVDQEEKTSLMISAIEASAKLRNEEFKELYTMLSENDKNMKVRAAAFQAITSAK